MLTTYSIPVGCVLLVSDSVGQCRVNAGHLCHRYKDTGDYRTPREVVDRYKKHPWFRSERASTRTLNSVYFHDVGTPNIVDEYVAQHNVTVGTNLIAHQLRVVGLEGWMPESQEVLPCPCILLLAMWLYGYGIMT